MFAIAEQAKTEGNPVEGTSDERPIKLDGVSASDFESLLTVLYAGHFSANQSEPESSLIIPAFRLANMWNFVELRAYLMPLAEKVLTDTDKIAFAREFGADSWIIPAYTRLCQRKEPLDNEEAAKIGMEGVVFVSRVREERYSKPTDRARSCCGDGNGNFWLRCGNCNGRYDIHPLSDEGLRGEIDTWVKNGRVSTNSS